jgi:hypothetical protein
LKGRIILKWIKKNRIGVWAGFILFKTETSGVVF